MSTNNFVIKAKDVSNTPSYTSLSIKPPSVFLDRRTYEDQSVNLKDQYSAVLDKLNKTYNKRRDIMKQKQQALRSGTTEGVTRIASPLQSENEDNKSENSGEDKPERKTEDLQNKNTRILDLKRFTKQTEGKKKMQEFLENLKSKQHSLSTPDFNSLTQIQKPQRARKPTDDLIASLRKESNLPQSTMQRASSFNERIPQNTRQTTIQRASSFNERINTRQMNDFEDNKNVQMETMKVDSIGKSYIRNSIDRFTLKNSHFVNTQKITNLPNMDTTKKETSSSPLRMNTPITSITNEEKQETILRRPVLTNIPNLETTPSSNLEKKILDDDFENKLNQLRKLRSSIPILSEEKVREKLPAEQETRTRFDANEKLYSEPQNEGYQKSESNEITSTFSGTISNLSQISIKSGDPILHKEQNDDSEQEDEENVISWPVKEAVARKNYELYDKQTEKYYNEKSGEEEYYEDEYLAEKSDDEKEWIEVSDEELMPKEEFEEDDDDEQAEQEEHEEEQEEQYEHEKQIERDEQEEATKPKEKPKFWSQIETTVKNVEDVLEKMKKENTNPPPDLVNSYRKIKELFELYKHYEERRSISSKILTALKIEKAEYLNKLAKIEQIGKMNEWEDKDGSLAKIYEILYSKAV